jgi:hypothetical protein
MTTTQPIIIATNNAPQSIRAAILESGLYSIHTQQFAVHESETVRESRWFHYK